MADYSRRELVTHTVEFAVPASGDGACWVEVYKAVAVAHQELAELGRIGRHPNGKPKDAPDDMITIRPFGDEIIVSYVIEETGR